ncbi:tRNA pseudouridine(13) synthase [hydrothermal vent metagenome]|uniref:tRNA pseudouridine(13) synthase n=1 Tax=hydrothermal vent metagenome TaxID=652676 RepID=A0A3B0VRW8_9ZZZZ
MTVNFNTLFPTINTVSGHGNIRNQAEDFMVIEHHDMTFTGTGEHLWFKVEKIHSNTAWVATQLASACKVPARQVGFAGLKDRHAITQQWFSVQLPKISEIELIKGKLADEIKILEHHWHQSKIKTGQLKFNEFKLVVRNVQGDRTAIEQNIHQVTQNGVPNYFGPQRFGHDMNNIQQAKDWFAGKIKVNNKKLRGLLISTARSHIFNLIVAHRIESNSWQQVISGDILQLDQSHSWFPAHDATSEELTTRLAAFDVHLTAALWGEDAVQSTEQCAAIEINMASTLAEYQAGFITHRVKQDRRAIRIVPAEFNHHWSSDGSNDDLHLSFKLQPGAYATSVLREIIKTINPAA